ncbi:class I SAM-dependent methyltransferase [Thalassobacillus hwangdonensis]|uniref:Class I SAM-dependent methyltransferase n=1 Tax=Thalassobacillus hwangdonensis TaxID=546108 RepID=A0ABW3L3N0_9BACI
MKDERKASVIHTFSKHADAYVHSETHSKGEDLPIMKEKLQLKKDDIALDIATGGGHVAKQLAPHVHTVFATDLTKKMLQNTSGYLTDYSNIHYVVADAEELPFLDDSFDVVTCRIAPHHFPHPERFIEEVARVLKPGGRFAMIDNIAPENEQLAEFYNSLEKMRDESHVRALRISEWEALLAKNNLSIYHKSLRKKTLPYENWVTRTLDDAEEIEKVRNHLVSANEDTKTHFQIKEESGKIESFAIDEWMVLSRK